MNKKALLSFCLLFVFTLLTFAEDDDNVTYSVVIKNSMVGGLKLPLTNESKIYHNGDSFSSPNNLTAADFEYIEDPDMKGCVVTLSENTITATYTKLKYDCNYRVIVGDTPSHTMVETEGVPEGWYLLYNAGLGSYVVDINNDFYMKSDVMNYETTITHYAEIGGSLFHITRSPDTEGTYYNIVSNFGHNVHITDGGSSYSDQAENWTIEPITGTDTHFALTDLKDGVMANGKPLNGKFVGFKYNGTMEIRPNHHYVLIPVEVRPYSNEEIEAWMETINQGIDYFIVSKEYMQESFEAINKAIEDNDEAAVASAFCNARTHEKEVPSEGLNFPKSGRYLIKNKGTGRYLTNYGNLMNIVTPNYYSIWDLERKDDENGKITYTFRNEGTQYVMTPQGGRTDDGTANKGQGYLSYTAGKSKSYNCNTEQEGAATFEFIPNNEGYARWRCVDDTNEKGDTIYYACLMSACDKTWETEAGMIKPTPKKNSQFDQTIESALCEGSNALWEVIPLKGYDENSSDNVTVAHEYSLFYNAAKTEMEYYCGGPVTLENVGSVKCLNDIMNNIIIYLNKIKEKDPSNLDSAAEHAGYYSNVVQEMYKLGTNTETRNYYLSLSPNRIFFLENMDRPVANARLTDNPDGKSTWHTEANIADNDTRAMWTLEEANDGYYIKNYKSEQYISTSLGATDSQNDALVINYTEVVPGIYRLRYDSGNNYLTITGSIKNWALLKYNNLELSSLWKIKSFSTVNILGNTAVTEDKDGIFGEGSINISTFSHPLCMRIYPYGSKHTSSKSEEYDVNVKAYYASGKGISSDGHLQVTLTQVTPSDNDNGYTYLEPEQGFLLVGYGADMKLNEEEKPIMEIYGGDKPSDFTYFNKPNGPTNLFSSTPNAHIAISSENQKAIFAVANVAKGTQIGTWQGNPVYATGLGFYNLKVGGKVGQYRAYIHKNVFSDYVWTQSGWSKKPTTTNANAIKRLTGNSDEVDGTMGIQMILQDTEGRETGIIDVDADGNTRYTPYIYDLSGRRVERPGKGIYIVNGEKKLFE